MRKKLLLADDSITIQKVVELTFPSDEFEVVTAGNGRIAVDKAMTFLPDVVLCDVIMPQLDGYQVCEALRASDALKNVPILLLNGAFEPYDADRAKSVGALGNVSKPFDPPALVARVKEILAEHHTGNLHRPTQPMSVEAISAISEGHEEVRTSEVVPVHPAVHAYDDSETHPVSTVEVPLGVRELAARSLSLDAPVFAVQEPEVLNTEPADFAETLHGPLDADVPGAMIEHAMEAPVPETVEEIESIEEIESVTSTTEPAPVEAAAPVPEEHAEFDPEPAHEPVEEVPSTLPPMQIPLAASSPMIEFSGEHEFDPHELDAHATDQAASAEPSMPEPEAIPMPPAAAQPEAMAVPEPVAEIEHTPEPAVSSSAPITSGALETAIGMRAFEPEPPPPPAPTLEAPAMTAAAVAASSTGLSGLVELQPEPAEHAEPSAETFSAPPGGGNGLPSAEVAVPVDMVQQIAQRVISQVSERVIREIAWDVIPGLAEKLIKAEIERIKARAESERD